jgi:hypothetical protein
VSENGRLPPSELAPIQNGQLRRDAAGAWNAMNVEARAKGTPLRPTGPRSSYRTYAQQVELYDLYRSGRGSLAAWPGTSNHGWGLAVDVASQDMRAMINRIGEPYGWAKKWSDAQSEWWHIKWREGSWSGPDPGPHGGSVAPAPVPTPERTIKIGGETMHIAVMQNKDGRMEVFVIRESDGACWHRWQTEANGKWGAWAYFGNPTNVK